MLTDQRRGHFAGIAQHALPGIDGPAVCIDQVAFDLSVQISMTFNCLEKLGHISLAEKCYVGAEGIDNLESTPFAEFGIYESSGPEAIELVCR